MLWWLIPLLLMILSALTIVCVVMRKVSLLRVIHVEALPQERTKHIKEAIIMQRFQRFVNKRLEEVRPGVRAGIKRASAIGRRLAQRVYALEQYYRKLERGLHEGPHATDAETVRRLMEEADALAAKEEYFEAEKRLIEIISHQPKHVKAYEALGKLYLKDKQEAQARETLAFAATLDAEDASVQVALGELEMREGNPKAARARFGKAIEIRPHNPKYLDYFIESALVSKDAAAASRGLELLRAVNPENKKLEEFSSRIEALGGETSSAS
jgi:Flp pilus assembly protein TadD